MKPKKQRDGRWQPTSFRFEKEVAEVVEKVHELTGYPRSAFVAEAILQYAPKFCEIHARRRLEASSVVKGLKAKA